LNVRNKPSDQSVAAAWGPLMEWTPPDGIEVPKWWC